MTDTTQKNFTPEFQAEKQKQLDAMVKHYEKEVESLEKVLVAFALEYELYLSLGDYGTGRTLLLDDNNWSDKKRGEWFYSSESC
jgi:hypothetical protein